MPEINDMRRKRREGKSISEIARETGRSRPTVRKYLEMDDFSPEPPEPKGLRSPLLDPFRADIEAMLEEDERNWRKQRHSAKRIFERLRDERGCEASYSTVRRYVAALRAERSEAGRGYLTLEWAPGEAQCDFGEADFRVYGQKRRLYYLVLSFPYSNVGVAQVAQSTNAECTCQALQDIFEFLGGVPTRIVFDNATGVGRRVADGCRTTELFGRLSAHYGFDFTFCNPEAGHEKGNVERKVAYVRDHLFVPVPDVYSLEGYNERLLARSVALSDGKPHWLKGEEESQLFFEDRFALQGLPELPFRCVGYSVAKANKQGKVKFGGDHWYAAGPAQAGRPVTVEAGASTVRLISREGEVVAEHPRAYGKAPTDSADPVSQLPLLINGPGGWVNSQVRAALPDELRSHLDSLPKESLRDGLRAILAEAERSGWASALGASVEALLATGRVDEATVHLAAGGLAAEPVDYDEPVDLSVYDGAFERGRS